MIKFSDCKKFPSNPGDRVHILYESKVFPDGTIELVQCGKEDFQDFIESWTDSCDMTHVLTQLRNGDLSVLNQRPGMYGNFTEMPSTLAEFMQLQIDSDRMFDSLPIDVKQEFDNDKNKFFAQAGNQEWYEKLKPVMPEDVKKQYFPDEPDIFEKEVVANES